MLLDYNDILTTDEVAQILRLNERTIIKLVKENKIPAVKIANQYRYSKQKIIEWIETEINNSPDIISEPDNSELNYQVLINHYIKPDHINTNLMSTNPGQVIEELVETASGTGLVRDSKALLASIVQRENTMTTALGHNFALPHPRICTNDMVIRGLIVIGISKPGIIFDNNSDKLINIFLLFAVPDLKQHLNLMSYFVKVLKNRENNNLILKMKSSVEILSFLSNLPDPQFKTEDA